MAGSPVRVPGGYIPASVAVGRGSGDGSGRAGLGDAVDARKGAGVSVASVATSGGVGGGSPSPPEQAASGRTNATASAIWNHTVTDSTSRPSRMEAAPAGTPGGAGSPLGCERTSVYGRRRRLPYLPCGPPSFRTWSLPPGPRDPTSCSTLVSSVLFQGASLRLLVLSDFCPNAEAVHGRLLVTPGNCKMFLAISAPTRPRRPPAHG